jgi:hypothetical protein
MGPCNLRFAPDMIGTGEGLGSIGSIGTIGIIGMSLMGPMPPIAPLCPYAVGSKRLSRFGAGYSLWPPFAAPM